MIRLIASDLDGTLLLHEPGSKSHFSQRTLDALKAAINAGAMVSAVSGRMLIATKRFADMFGSNAPIIAYNGALIYDAQAGVELKRFDIPLSTTRDILKRLEELGLYVQYYPGETFWVERETPETLRYAGDNLIEAVVTNERLSLAANMPALKLLCIDDAEKIARALPVLRGEFGDRVNIVRSHPTYMEIMAAGADKGAALRTLAEHLSVDASDILAFGDAENDVPMLKYAGISYAMGNSEPTVRAQAKFTAPRYDDDGAAQVIEKYLSEGAIGGL